MTNSRKWVVLSIGVFLGANTLFAQQKDSSASRFFIQANMALRHLNAKNFNYWFYLAHPINNEPELSACAGVLLGKGRKGLIKTGYNYLPDFRSDYYYTMAPTYINDSETITWKSHVEGRFSLR